MRPLSRRAGARAALALLATALASSPARAGDPHLVFHTIDTPHFEITYYDPLGPVAQRLARIAEAVYARLTPVMGWEPRERTQLVFVDWTDEANGSANAVPYDEVRLYLTAPDDLSQLNDYDDWLTALITHEYTHILHLDHIGGIPALVNDLIGKTYSPNDVEPRWFVEGYAVLQESTQTSGGRLRSSIFDMYLRMAILDGLNWHGLDQTSNDPLTFPQATTAYLSGGRFLRFLTDRFGMDALARMAAIYGSTTIPFAMNETARRVTGSDYPSLWQQWKSSLERRYALQAAEVARRGETPFRPLTAVGQTVAAPRYSHDGRHVQFIQEDGHHRDGYYAIDEPDASEKPLPAERSVVPIEGAGAGSFTPDDRRFVFQRLDFWNTYYLYDDLFVLDETSGEVRQLTHGLRANEPDVSPDGTQVAFTVNDRGTRSLAVMPLDGAGGPRILYPSPALDQVYTPVWSHDGTRIAFSAWRQGGDRDVYVLTVATGEVDRLTADRALDVDPRFSPDDRYLYFCSDRTGIYDLYAYDLAARRLLQVTNVIDGVFQPDISPDGRHAVYVGFSSLGYDLHEVALDPASFRPAEPYVSDRPDPSPDTLRPAAERAQPASYPVRDYDPLETLWPHSWCPPSAGTNGPFGSFLGECVNGGDAVGYHGWDAAVTYNPGNNSLTGSADYAYTRLWPALGAHVGRDLYPRSGLFIDGRNTAYTEQAVSTSASVGLPLIQQIDRFLRLTLGYGLTWTGDVAHEAIPLDPTSLLPRYPATGRLGGMGLQLGYTNQYGALYAVGPIAGRSFGLGLQLDHPALGSEWSFLVATAGYSESLQLPWNPDQTLQLRAAAGITRGNYPRGGVFGLGGFSPPVTLLAYAPQTLLFDALESENGGEPPLRGYAPGIRYGSIFQAASVQYQFPLLLIEHGYETLPVYVRRLEGALYSDAGNAYDGSFHASQLLWGVGGELRLDMQFGWYVPGTIVFGYAHGLTGPAIGQWYIAMGGPL